MNPRLTKQLLHALLGAVIAFSLLLMPVQASIVIEKNDMAAMMTVMSASDCAARPCADAKADLSCDLTMNCAAGCIGFNLFPAMDVAFMPVVNSVLTFAPFKTALVSFETLPLRRPPRT